eukprot:3246250-Pleurochrysis_carterae.AAC.1
MLDPLRVIDTAKQIVFLVTRYHARPTPRHACGVETNSHSPAIASARCLAPLVGRGPAASARALLASRERRIAGRHARGSGRKGITFVVDSGCTWHVHPHARDL